LIPKDSKTCFISSYQNVCNELIQFGFCTTNQPVNNAFSKNGVAGFSTFMDLLERAPED